MSDKAIRDPGEYQRFGVQYREAHAVSLYAGERLVKQLFSAKFLSDGEKLLLADDAVVDSIYVFYHDGTLEMTTKKVFSDGSEGEYHSTHHLGFSVLWP